eukprot:1146627-Pelagomonas_calceolata.AAC.4
MRAMTMPLQQYSQDPWHGALHAHPQKFLPSSALQSFQGHTAGTVCFDMSARGVKCSCRCWQ